MGDDVAHRHHPPLVPPPCGFCQLEVITSPTLLTPLVGCCSFLTVSFTNFSMFSSCPKGTSFSIWVMLRTLSDLRMAFNGWLSFRFSSGLGVHSKKSFGVHFSTMHNLSNVSRFSLFTLFCFSLVAKLSENPAVLRKEKGRSTPRALKMRSKLYRIILSFRFQGFLPQIYLFSLYHQRHFPV